MKHQVGATVSQFLSLSCRESQQIVLCWVLSSECGGWAECFLMTPLIQNFNDSKTTFKLKPLKDTLQFSKFSSDPKGPHLNVFIPIPTCSQGPEPCPQSPPHNLTGGYRRTMLYFPLPHSEAIERKIK